MVFEAMHGAAGLVGLGAALALAPTGPRRVHCSGRRHRPSRRPVSSRGEIDDGFVALLLADLVPVGIYVAGARRPNTVMFTGYALFLAVAGSWTLFGLEDGNQFAGLWVFFGWALVLVATTAGARRDSARRRSQS